MPHDAAFADLPPLAPALVTHRFTPQGADGGAVAVDADGAFTLVGDGDADYLRVSGGDWTRATHLVVDARGDEGHISALVLRIYAAGEAEPRIHCTLGTLPGLPTRLSFPLAHLDGQTIFPRRTPGRLKAICFGRRIAPAEVAEVRLSLQKAGHPQRLHLRGLCLTSDGPDHPVAARVLVDALGQHAGATWPGKTRDADGLVAALRAELATADGAAYPVGWSRWGGDGTMRSAATGFFRTERRDDRWWLVDPDGCAWWSAGLDCLRPTQDTALLPGMERLCAWTPLDDPAYAAAVRTGRNGQRQIDFMVANLIRAFGDGWMAAWTRLTGARMRRWRFTTVGNWSDHDAARAMGLPYVLPMPAYPTTAVTLFRDLPDVFAPEFTTAAQAFAQFLAPFRDDPLLVGYFLANEPHWGFGRFNLASEMLEAHPGTHTRRALARWLSERHGGDCARLAQAWGVAIGSFAEFETRLFHRLADQSKAADADLWEFSRLIARENLRVPSAACKMVAPHHLNLGLRYAWIASDLCYEGAEHCDVFTINCYQMAPDRAMVDEIAARTGRPVLIGEWHMGALDRGLPATGLRAVTDQVQRGVAYRRYLEWCAAHPAVVGAHWFTLNDQSFLGRFDGENFQIGFVDVCHHEYPEIGAAAATTHERMYAVRRGDLPAFAEAASEAPRIAF